MKMRIGKWIRLKIQVMGQGKEELMWSHPKVVVEIPTTAFVTGGGLRL
jgi:hypothetical protein